MNEGPIALAAGTRLHEFELIRVLGEGGFGVVYLARDLVQQRLVAIKEYMPSSLARRGAGTLVQVRSEREAGLFRAGLASFLAEARMLARFDHPALVRMYHSWEEHGTAYTVMPYYEGITLKVMRDNLAGVPDESLLRRLLDTLLGALGVLHDENVYHRDISPDNIIMQPDGRPVLLDFGAARQVISDRTQSLTSILKPNFAPIEQYSHSGEMKQGPWTDLYSLGAVMYFMMVGHPPPPAAARALDDELPLLARLSADGVLPVSASLGAVIDWCLEFRPQHRPQSVAEVRAALEGRCVPPAPIRRERHAPRGEGGRPGGRWATTVDVDTRRVPRPARIAGALTLSLPRRTLVLVAVPVLLVAAGWGLSRGDPAPASPPPVATAASSEATGPAGRAVTTVTTVTTVTAAPAEEAPPKTAAKAVPARSAPSKDPPAPTERAAKAGTGPWPARGTPPTAVGARASCSGRSVFTLPFCLRTACAKPEFSQDADCVELAEADRRHREAMQRY